MNDLSEQSMPLVTAVGWLGRLCVADECGIADFRVTERGFRRRLTGVLERRADIGESTAVAIKDAAFMAPVTPPRGSANRAGVGSPDRAATRCCVTDRIAPVAAQGPLALLDRAHRRVTTSERAADGRPKRAIIVRWMLWLRWCRRRSGPE